MIHILILAAGDSALDGERYPLFLAEIGDAPLIERQIKLCEAVTDARLVVAVTEHDLQSFAVAHVIALLAPGARVASIKEKTRGAACTAMLALGPVGDGDELLILNGNEFLDMDFAAALDDFRGRGLDAGVVTFPSVHPRYSFVRLSGELVVQAAEKRPISRNATAGFYWFKRARDFVEAAQTMIRKDATVNDSFYICPTLNELVLRQMRIGVYPIAANRYHPLKTERQIRHQEWQGGFSPKSEEAALDGLAPF